MAINFSPCRASYNQTRKENFTEVCFSLTVLYEHIFKRKKLDYALQRMSFSLAVVLALGFSSGLPS